MPNGNIVTFPADLYLFFETESLLDASPAFTSQIGIIVTDDEDISWKNIGKRYIKLFVKRHQGLIQKY